MMKLILYLLFTPLIVTMSGCMSMAVHSDELTSNECPYYASYVDCMMVIAPLHREFWKSYESTGWPVFLIFSVVDLPFSALLDTVMLPDDLKHDPAKRLN
jgi:uncharacterized protein YceK